jgi:transposase
MSGVAMDLGRYLVEAVLQEGRSPSELAAAHGVSRSWVYELLARHRADPEHGLEARSRRPGRSPTQVSIDIEERVVALRKELTEGGFDAGAHTIHYHLAWAGGPVPSTSTIWRILKRRGFVTPQPQKRPRSSLVRFEADLPNECWQADTTHWAFTDGTDVEILNIIDDHSRLLIASVAHHITRPRMWLRASTTPLPLGASRRHAH